MKINIPIEIIELEESSYHLMIPIHIQKQHQGYLIIDTGASKTVFDYNLLLPFAKDIEDADSEQSSGINSMISGTYTCLLPEISFADFSITDFATILLDLSHINQLYSKYTNKEITGLLGSDFLVENKALINYDKKLLTLKISKRKCKK